MVYDASLIHPTLALPLSAEGELISRELGLILRPQGDLLRLVDSYTGQMLATSKEYAGEVARAKAKIIELQQELDRLRREKD